MGYNIDTINMLEQNDILINLDVKECTIESKSILSPVEKQSTTPKSNNGPTFVATMNETTIYRTFSQNNNDYILVSNDIFMTQHNNPNCIRRGTYTNGINIITPGTNANNAGIEISASHNSYNKCVYSYRSEFNYYKWWWPRQTISYPTETYYNSDGEGLEFIETIFESWSSNYQINVAYVHKLPDDTFANYPSPYTIYDDFHSYAQQVYKITSTTDSEYMLNTIGNYLWNEVITVSFDVTMILNAIILAINDDLLTIPEGSCILGETTLLNDPCCCTLYNILEISYNTSTPMLENGDAKHLICYNTQKYITSNSSGSTELQDRKSNWFLRLSQSYIFEIVNYIDMVPQYRIKTYAGDYLFLSNNSSNLTAITYNSPPTGNTNLFVILPYSIDDNEINTNTYIIFTVISNELNALSYNGTQITQKDFDELLLSFNDGLSEFLWEINDI